MLSSLCNVIADVQRMNKSYSELIKFPSFSERLEYLKTNSTVGFSKWEDLRYLNQKFYSSAEWKRIRRDLIIRDMGCDLGVEGLYLPKRYIIIHHINPISPEDLIERTPLLTDLENLICCSSSTHQQIHYRQMSNPIVERAPNDTCPWRK